MKTVLRRCLALVALLGVGAGCGDDGPSSGVRAAASASTPTADEALVGEAAGSLRATGGASRPLAVDGWPAGEAAPVVVGGDGDPIDVVTSALPDSVAVVGDSLTLSATDEIEAAFAGLGVEVVAIDALENRRMARGGSSLPPGTDAVEAIVESGELPDLWVVALGTNDVGAQASNATFGDDVAAVLRRIPAGSPVVWVDVWIRDRSEAASEANDLIRSMLTFRPGSHVVDWYRHGELPEVITSDGVHLTDLGQVRFADAMVDGVVELTTG